MRRALVMLLGVALALGAGLNGTRALAEDGVAPPERITWRKVPITLVLTVGRERLVHFSGPVKVGIPASLEGRVRAQSVDGTVYLLAHEPFEPKRVMVRELSSGRVYLLDLTASETAGQNHQVIIHAAGAEEGARAADGSTRDDSRAPGRPRYGYPTLIRFAAQALYAPSRLLRDLPGVIRTPVRREPVALLRGGAVTAIPLVAWRAGALHVTAVKLVNRTAVAQVLDPRALRGEWLAAAFQHHRLFPAGDEADTTAVYLISARPFEASTRAVR